MPLLGDDDATYLRDSFATLTTDVTLTLVTRERSRLVMPGADAGDDGGAPDTTAELRQIVVEVAATSPRLKVERVDAAADADRAAALAGELTPAIVFSAAGAHGKLRYFGLPAGYEMSTLIAAILDLGSSEPMVPTELAEELGKLSGDVHIQVFVTPSCPHCPAMARAAFQLAMSSPRITADVVEVQEFPDVARKYQVRGVPMTIVNDGEPLMGNVGGARLFAAVRAAVTPATPVTE
jgi:glutaredoxin-like protein